MTHGGLDASQWEGPEGEVGRKVVDQSARCLRAYAENPLLIEEHANIERATAQGGYGRRQIYELVQNGADEMIGHPGGRIHVLLTDEALYCANEGRPITPRGVEAILSAALSVKRGDEIGRFGMGFKSVLGVTELPDFFSRTGSFRFDAHWAAKKIREIKPDAERTPVLRIAYPLDPERASSTDPVLRELMSWASTVVRLPIDRSESDWLAEDVQKFPPEFLLFSPHVGELVLEDRLEHVRRSITLTADRDTFLLREGGESATWKVFKTVHQPSAAARREAGELADRPHIPLVWAVPTEGRARTGRGQFWAFFPTHYRTTLSGILNAPWKTNEDRQNLLEGPFNEELLHVASRLIVENLASLAIPEDPAAHLDLMPARGREAPNWADQRITEDVYALAAQMNALPDQDGRLRQPAELECHPADLPTEALLEWASYPNRPKNWCHLTVDSRERRPRAERLLGLTGRSPSSLLRWLESLAADGTPEASITALRTASLVLQSDANTRRDIQASSIVLTNQGTLEAPNPDVLALPGEYAASRGELLTAHPEVVADPTARAFLLELGLRQGDPLQELRALIARSDRDPIDDWEHFWSLVRRLSEMEAVELLSRPPARQFTIHVKAMDGDFRPLPEVLLPGPVVSRDRGEDAAACLDDNYHATDLDLLRTLGATPAPLATGGSSKEEWFEGYVTFCRSRYQKHLERNPQWRYLVFREATFAGPMSPMLRFSEEGRAKFTEAALVADPSAQPWAMFHETRQHDYPTIEMPNPMVWLIQMEGRLHTSLGIKPPSECVSSSLAEWADFLPVVTNLSPGHEQLLGLPRAYEDLGNDIWKQALEIAHGVYDDLLRGRFYALASRYRSRPRHILARVGKAHQLIDPREVTVVADHREMEALAGQGTPVLLCRQEDVSSLVERWGLVAGEYKVRTSVEHVPASSPIPLADRWPLLGLALHAEARDMEVVPCDSLRRVTVTEEMRHVDDVDFYIAEKQILHDASMPERDLLRRISDELDLGLSLEDIEHIIDQRIQQDAANELRKIAEIHDPADRLIALVGVDPLRRLIGPALIESARRLLGDIDDRTIAELALAAHGVDILKVLQHELQRWSPPTQWAGSKRAREFVTSLGFEPEYAGFPSAERDAVVPVDGPLHLPKLHNYQRAIANQLRDLLVDPRDNRGLVWLPTGAGKTRVVVQTLIEAHKEGDLSGPILWVAQGDELCEQAVQAWKEVWRSEGPEERMQINRLWGSNEAVESEGDFQVVVATIQKLRERYRRPDYAWLWQARCLVVDEAHQSVTRDYTELLDAFGMARGKRGVPLIGLTATPFRGENEAETKQLVSRYGGRLIQVPDLGPRPYETLQNMGVLAKVEHEVLSGSDVELTDDEREHLESFRKMPSSVEERLARDEDRNAMLIHSIRSLPEDWTVLLFAASVNHAQHLAALLSLEGVPARAISAETEDGARRHYVEQFRRGNIRVLTNYNVLTQGFDAPAVRAVYVARPTFSRNLYQQMIGRGLRGPLNGGSDVCRIVNVEDNFLMYGDELAFHHFDYLWTQDSR